MKVVMLKSTLGKVIPRIKWFLLSKMGFIAQINSNWLSLLSGIIISLGANIITNLLFSSNIQTDLVLAILTALTELFCGVTLMISAWEHNSVREIITPILNELYYLRDKYKTPREQWVYLISLYYSKLEKTDTEENAPMKEKLFIMMHHMTLLTTWVLVSFIFFAISIGLIIVWIYNLAIQ
jgi:hypothetical protein